MAACPMSTVAIDFQACSFPSVICIQGSPRRVARQGGSVGKSLKWEVGESVLLLVLSPLSVSGQECLIYQVELVLLVEESEY